MNEVIEVTEPGHLEEIVAANDNVVVDFGAEAWCQPCKQFSPHFKAAAEKTDATFVYVDVDKAPWATSEYGIRGVPTVKQFKGGQLVGDIKSRTVVALLAEIES